jgi:outer membrane putative beta-barrel porin/alpha-amylase
VAPVVSALLLSLALLAAPPGGAGDEPVPARDAAEAPLPCRPTIACTAEFVSPGKIELELGYAGRDLGGALQHSTPLLVKVTVTEDLQLQLGGNGLVVQRGVGGYLDTVLLAAKARVLAQGETRPALAVSAALGVPTSHRQRTLDPTLAQGIAYVTKDLASIHADLNVGATLFARGGTTRAQPFGALALSYDLGHALTGMLETYLFADARPLDTSDHGLLAAVGWNVAPQVVIDLGADWGMGGQARRLTAFVGATMLGPRMWRS